jgi:hypothetical protein
MQHLYDCKHRNDLSELHPPVGYACSFAVFEEPIPGRNRVPEDMNMYVLGLS